MLGVQAGEMHQKLHAAQSFGAFWEWVMGTRASAVLEQPHGTRVPLGEALAWLRQAVRQGEAAY